MKRIVVMAALTVGTAGLMLAQAPAPPAEATLPMILNVLPVMGNLDRAEEFYHRLLGLESNIGIPGRGLRGIPTLLSSKTCTPCRETRAISSFARRARS